MLHLPPVSHKSRDYFEVADLVAVTTAPIIDRPTKRESIVAAQRSMRGNKAIRRVFSIAMAADDEWQLLSIGPRGGVKILWRFGKTYSPNHHLEGQK